MGDIQKPSNIPPVSIERLNDYNGRQKDKWINNKLKGRGKISREFKPELIYYLATTWKVTTSGHQMDEMIGYIIPYSGNIWFLPFYKRINILGLPTKYWEDYTTNFELGNLRNYDTISDLGINEPADRERQEREQNRQRGEIAALKKVEPEDKYGIELKTKNPETGKFDLGGSRRRSTRRRKLKKSKKSRKSRKSRK